MKLKSILIGGLTLFTLGTYTSCTDMMDTNSKLVMFSQDNKLDGATDTVYSVMGIIGKMQAIADRTVLLGEIRGDLVELTPKASIDLQELAQFNVSSSNTYNAATGYYAVINNCNFYLAHVDTSLKKRNEYVFMKEFAAVKTFRAWTYLQLAMTYGSVPFIIDPILTEAQANKTYPMKDIKQICDYFVDDLLPYVNTPFPGYGAINGLDSKKFFLPTRVVLGDLCLWGERYAEAAKYYHDFLTKESGAVSTGLNQTIWNKESTTFGSFQNSYSNLFSNVSNSEIISFIPMESTSTMEGYSGLRNVFNSTIQNNYYFHATPSHRLMELSKAQSNCILFVNGSLRDTLYAPIKNDEKPLWVGDLRLASVYTVTNGSAGTNDGNATTSNLYSTIRQTIGKFSTGHVILYRSGEIYLRFAEALNRAGYPESAFAILKYGLYPANITRYINAGERTSAANLLTFSQYQFSANNTLGIHSRGSGDAYANKTYKIPTKANLTDSINYVEDLICNETALETSFEGCRYYDLVRMALHRNDTEWLATKIAQRKGSANEDAALKLTLSDRKNWFLPLK
jgi:starch-binding outer membrane protein, SusD/RagB family